MHEEKNSRSNLELLLVQLTVGIGVKPLDDVLRNSLNDHLEFFLQSFDEFVLKFFSLWVTLVLVRSQRFSQRDHECLEQADVSALGSSLGEGGEAFLEARRT